MRLRWQGRQRAKPEVITWAKAHFQGVFILDGSTLDALLRKVGLLRERKGVILAGRIAALLDCAARLPEQIWYYEEDNQAHDLTFWERAVEMLSANTLLIFDLGFINHLNFEQLTERTILFVTQMKKGAAYKIERVLHTDAHVHDYIIRLGSGKRACNYHYRLIEVEYQGAWYRYLTTHRFCYNDFISCGVCTLKAPVYRIYPVEPDGVRRKKVIHAKNNPKPMDDFYSILADDFNPGSLCSRHSTHANANPNTSIHNHTDCHKTTHPHSHTDH
jgi:hypothetical protein